MGDSKPGTSRGRWRGSVGKVLDVLIVLSFLILWLIYATDGFVFEFFGATVRATHIKNPLAAISLLWIVKVMFFSEQKRSALSLLRKGLIFAFCVGGLLLLNTVVSRYWLNAGGPDSGARRAGRPPAPAVGEHREWNVLLISIDTLRPDHLGCYGYGRDTSPAVDDLAARGVRLENHIAAAPSTLPSHASIFTSLYPSAHQAEVSSKTSLGDDVVSLTEVLKKQGYRTAAFSGGGQLHSSYRLDQGFDVYDDRGGGVAAVTDRALAWLRDRGDERFFMFFHTYETHHPYDPPSPYDGLFYPEYGGSLGKSISVYTLARINNGTLEIDESDLRHIVAMYDGEIAYTDSLLTRLFRELQRLDLWNSTLVVFTSDHGEEFDEHGKVGWHSHTLYEELLQVPLIIRLPDESFQGAVVRGATSGVDLYPTILDILQIGIPPGLQGTSFLPLLDQSAPEPPRPILSERERMFFHQALRYGEYKLHLEEDLTDVERTLAGLYIFSKKAYAGMKLFKVSEDRGETKNLFKSRKKPAAALKERMREILAENRRLSAGITSEEADVDDALNEQLKALGYLR